MTTKLSSDELNDVMIEGLVLSVALVQRFETMIENKLIIHKTKQAVNNASKLLSIYVDKVFDVSHEDDNTKNHMKKGASHLTELDARLERSLKTDHLMSISQRKEILLQLIEETTLFPKQKTELYENIRDSGILNY